MSEPVAWLAFATDGSESSTVTLLREHAEAAARDWGWSVEPLFAALTDEERKAVDAAAHAVAQLYVGPEGVALSATLRGLLERLK